jgi:hypothetical protein
MLIKLNGSHDVLRTFCQNVREFVNNVVECRKEDDLDDLENEIISDISCCLSYHQETPIPLNHITITTIDEEDEDMVEWIKGEPMHLFGVLYMYLAERVVVSEMNKFRTPMAA